MNGKFPHVRVTGDPRERGRAYGEQARSRIARSIEAYREVFRAYAGWEWDQVRREAARFEAPIAAFDQRYVQEIRGIAAGAGVDHEQSADLETAVRAAAKKAREGEVVLLAPACASYDQFRDFEERGTRFRELVEAL